MKNKMLLTSVITLLLIGNAFGQEQPSKIHELGLTFTGLNSFGISYKTGTEKTLFRVSTVWLNLFSTHAKNQNIDSIKSNNLTSGVAFRIGFEKPISIKKNFSLFYGADLAGEFSYSKATNWNGSMNTTSSSWIVSPGVSFVFGGSYLIGEHFRISAELLPTLSYLYKHDNNGGTIYNTNRVGFGLSNSGANITVAYRFSK